jgi:nucleoid DNA-binding protein
MAPTKSPIAKSTTVASAMEKAAPKPKPAVAAATVKKAMATAKTVVPKPAAKAAITAAKPVAAPKATAAKPAAQTPAARPAAPRARPVVTPGSGKVIKLKDLLDHVVKATGGKKKAVKETVTATLDALGAALSRGDGLNLPALGKAQVNRQRTLAEGEMIIVKLRRHDAKTGGKKTAAAPLAKPAKEG